MAACGTWLIVIDMIDRVANAGVFGLAAVFVVHDARFVSDHVFK